MVEPRIAIVENPAPQYALLEFSKSILDCRILWPDLIDRVSNFINRYEADMDPDWLFVELNKAFHQGNPDWLILAEIESRSRKITGHLICQAQPYGRLGQVAFVHQLEHDDPAAEVAQQLGWHRLRQWAEKKNIRLIMNYARTQAVARLYRQKYGFEDRRVLQSFDLLQKKT